MSKRLLRRVVVLLAAGVAAAGPGAKKSAWQRLLQGDDARKAVELQQRIDQLQQAGKFEEAVPSAEALVQLRQERQGKEHWQAVDARFQVEALRRAVRSGKEDRQAYAGMLGLQDRAEALEQAGRFREALPLREQVAAIRHKVLGEDHPDTVQSYVSVASNLHDQGRHQEAEAGSRKALALCRKVLGEDHPDTGKAYSTLAQILNDQGLYRGAEEAFRKALDITAAALGEEHVDTAMSYNNLATSLQNQGLYVEAEKAFRKALALYRKVLGENHGDLAIAHNNLASTLEAQGKYADAEQGFRRALDLARKALGEEHPTTAACYNNLAFNLYRQGRYAEAEVGLRQALAINLKVLGEKHPRIAFGWNNLALDLEAQGKSAEAEEGFRKALALRIRALGEEHPQTATGYMSLAAHLDDQGKYVEAEEGFRKALEISRKALGEEHPSTARCYHNLGANLIRQGRYREAEAAYRRALEIFRKACGPDHPDTAENSDSVASTLVAQGRYEEAERYFVQGADSFLACRRHLAQTGLGRAAKTTEMSPLLRLAALLARNGKPADAWQRLEQGLGRGCWDDLSARLRQSAPETARQTELTARLDRLDQLLGQLSIPGAKPAQQQQRDDLLERRRQAQEELTQFSHALENKYGPAVGQVLPRGTVQAALPDDTALIGWIDIPPVGPEAAEDNSQHWAVLLRSQGEPIFERLRGSGPAGEWTKEDTFLPWQLRAAVESPRGNWRELARRLQNQRLKPLRRHLGNSAKLPAVRHLIVLPSSLLRGVPLELAAENYTISYAASGTLYAHLRKQPGVKSSGLLALGDPVFEPTAVAAAEHPLPPGGVLLSVVQPGSNAAAAQLLPGDVLLKYGDQELNTPADLKAAVAAADPKTEVVLRVWRDGTSFRKRVRAGALGVVVASQPAREAVAERYRLDRRLSSRGGDDGWQALPGTRVEVEALHRLFGDKAEPTLLFDSEASEQKLDELAQSGHLGRYRYLHLATHGEVNDRWPLRSALILSRDALPDPQQQLLAGKPVYDGRLTAEGMLRNWKLNSELVTLSACQTALGKYESGEGFVGFAQVLILCGSRSVCLSLWKVDDAATALLMQRFYANLLGQRDGLKGPLGKAAALAEAKQWLRTLSREEALRVAAAVSQGVERGKDRPRQKLFHAVPPAADARDDRPYAHPYYWAAFILIGDPE
jgi:tetratricopeptide (TPR) repeat protein